MLSKKAKYAIRVLKVFAKEYGHGPMLNASISAKEHIPEKSLDRVLIDLRDYGLLQSQKGRGGGYSLRIEANRINLAQIIRAVDGPMVPAPCVSPNVYVRCDDCDDEQTCAIRPYMLRVRDVNQAIFEETTLTMLIERDEFAAL